MHRTYAHLDATREPVCAGCGAGHVALSHSHLLSQGQRPDLAAAEGNIVLHCFGRRDACHETWERAVPAELVRMRDHRANLAHVVAHDPRRGAWLRAKFEAAGVPWPLEDRGKIASFVSREAEVPDIVGRGVRPEDGEARAAGDGDPGPAEQGGARRHADRQR